LKALVQVAKIAARRPSFDGAIYGRDCIEGGIDGNGVRRQTDAATVGKVLEFGGERRQVDDDGLLPLVQAISQDEWLPRSQP
jgi:hypothetical protein